MQVSDHRLFPTRLLTIEVPDAGDLNRDLAALFERPEFRDDFDMHPDSLNLLSLADRHPCIARLGDLFFDGLRAWLKAEGLAGDLTADVVLFSNVAGKGDFTLVHNHNADVVGIYYVRTPDHGRPPMAIPDGSGDYDYFAAEDGVLVLHDPRFNANLAALRATDYVKVYPRPGLMLIFPAYLWHSVTPHRGDERRLAISANFRVHGKEAGTAVSRPLSI